MAELNTQYVAIPRVPAPQGRGGGRGGENNTTVPAPLSIAELNARYAAITRVCLILLLYLIFIY